MKTQDKEILLKDLCARLPYGVKVQVNRVGEWDGETKRFVVSKELTFDDVKSLTENGAVSDIKPYLRPMDTMTEKEIYELKGICDENDLCDECGDIVSTIYGMTVLRGEVKDVYPYDLKIKIFQNLNYAVLDFLNAHHLDYRRLIPMGLALPAPEGMYNF